MGFYYCSMFSCALHCVYSSFAIIKRELAVLLYVSSWCLVIVLCILLVVPRACLQFVIVVFTGHTHLLFLIIASVHSIGPGISFHAYAQYRKRFCLSHT